MNMSSHELRGKRNFLQGNLSVSVAEFSKVLEHHPESSSVRLARGAAHLKLGHFDEAIHDLTLVLEQGHDYEKAYFLKGIAHMNKSEFGEALINLNKSLEYNDKRGSALLARGMVLTSLGHYREAQNDIDNPLVKENVIIDDFLEEYAISETMFNQLLSLLDEEAQLWNLILTEDEIAKLESRPF